MTGPTYPPPGAATVERGLLGDHLDGLLNSLHVAKDVLRLPQLSALDRPLWRAALAHVERHAAELLTLLAPLDLSDSPEPWASAHLAERVAAHRDVVGAEAGEGDRDAAAEQDTGVGVDPGESDGPPSWLVGLRRALDVLESLGAVELEQLTGVVHLDHDTSSAVGSPGAGTPDVSARTVEAATDSSAVSAVRDVDGSPRGRREAFPGAPMPAGRPGA